MLQVATANGTRGPVPVGPEIQGVPQDIRDLLNELVDTEVPMDPTAAEKIMAAIGENNKAQLARVEAIKDLYHALDKRLTVLDSVPGKLNELDLRLDGVSARQGDTDTRLKDLADDVGVLIKAKDEADADKKVTKRTATNSLINHTVGGLVTLALVGIGFLVSYFVMLRPQPQPAPAATQDAQGGVITKINELLDEIRTDRAIRAAEEEAAKPASSKGKSKPRLPAPPGPVEGPSGARYNTGDVIADPNLRAHNSIRLESMEWRP